MGGGQRETRVQLDGALKQRNRRPAPLRNIHRLSRAVRLQRFERSRRRLDQGDFMFLHHRQRLADARSESAGDLAERVQNLFLLGHLDLFFIENVPVPAVLRAEAQYILTADGCKRTLQHGCTAAPCANLLSDFRREFCIGRLLHQRQHLADTLGRKSGSGMGIVPTAPPAPGAASRQKPGHPSCS